VRRSKNLSRFRTHYIGEPCVYAYLWELLQTTDLEKAQLNDLIKKVGAEKCFSYFLMAIHLMACYPTEEQAEGIFSKSTGVCDKTWSTWSWDIVSRIYNQHPDIIVWPDRWDNPDSESEEETIFIVTVDGAHCQIEEPTLDDFSENQKYFSHKFHGPALDYELAISVYTQDLVWINGPFPAGCHDLKVFRQGLKQKMLDTRAARGVEHRGIADKGYRGEQGLLSIPSSCDPERVRDFKGRALSRHETFNGRMKNFDCLDERFRHHDLLKHKHCFYAVAVICQLQLDCGYTLFEV